MPKGCYGYYTNYYYVGFMPDGTKGYFVSEREYIEAFNEMLKEREEKEE